ncbi:MAG: hypothetical protein ACFFFG_06320 [Candidatus Thorarchaeota archaeon]
MSFLFKKRQIRKFAEKAVERQNSIFVFGSNIFAEAFLERLIEIGAQSKVALIADRKFDWIEEIREQDVLVLVEERRDEYGKRNLYENIGFQHAEKVIILHEDPVIIQNIMSFIANTELKVILLAQFAPPFVHYLGGQKSEQIIIVDNLFQIVRELYRQMDLQLSKPPVVSIPIPKSLINRSLEDLKIPSVMVLNIFREEDERKILPLTELAKSTDRLMLYLEQPDSLSTLVDFLDKL